MQHVGLMMVRNEPDVLYPPNRIYFVPGTLDVVILDGAQCPEECVDRSRLPGIRVVKQFYDNEILRPGERFTDGHRSIALDFIRRNYGPNTWVTLLHPDEFFWDDPLEVAEKAQSEGASYVLWGEYRFFLHASDRGKPEDAPVTERLRWYCGPYFEVRQFYLREHHLYVPGRDHSVLPGPSTGKRASFIPRYRHYPYRSLTQVKAMVKDKIVDREWQPDHAWLVGREDDPYVDALPEPTNSPLAAWRNVARLGENDDLPDPQRFLPAWWKG